MLEGLTDVIEAAVNWREGQTDAIKGVADWRGKKSGSRYDLHIVWEKVITESRPRQSFFFFY